MKQLILIFVLIVFCSLLAEAQIPRTLSYQGVLTDSSGIPRADADYNFTFSLYDSGSGGKLLWNEPKSLLTKSGLFSTALGNATPFPDSLKFDRPYWLNISVNGIGELSPRIALTSVGYSMNSLRADTAKISMAGEAWTKADSLGYVGIGVMNDGSTKLLIHTDGGPQASIIVDHGGSNLKIRPISAGGTSTIIENTGAGSLCLNPTWGNVGIGTTNPNDILTINTPGGANPVHGLSIDVETFSTPTNAANSYFLRARDIGSGATQFCLRGDGNVGIGTGNPSAALDVIGHTRTQVLEITGGSDLAEPFPVSEESQLEEGSVVVIDESNPGHITLCTEPYDRKVAGVVSGAGGIKPGLTLKQEGLMEGSQNVALSGRVYVKATASNGSIKPGDRLVSSSIPGLCMKATDPSRCDGAVIGKAMSALSSGKGLVLLLINLQ